MIPARPIGPCRVPPARIRKFLLWPWLLGPVFSAAAPVELRVTDWAEMPLSGNITAGSGNPTYMSRVNFLRAEPGGAGRLWICDLNGNLHILDPSGTAEDRSARLLEQARTRSAYLDFCGNSATEDAAEKCYVPDAAGTSTAARAPNGLFPLFTKRQGYANGLVTFQFDPGYPDNGKFYTVHIEANSTDGTAGRLPVTTKFPGFDAAGYTPTPRISPAGSNPTRQAVLIEWTDTDRSNLSFEGTARELLRLVYNSHIHPLGDIAFHPTAQPGDPEWGVMYLASGDGGSGEKRATKLNPQRLDSMVGKILRIIPDLSLHTGTSSMSANGRYRIPDDNPFTDSAAYPGARKEIWTLGHRNPHRFFWQTPEGGEPVLLVAEIGLDAWEEVNLLKRGKNYGYSEREGPEKLVISSGDPVTGPPLSPDTMLVRISNLQAASGEFIPEYPVIAYPHTAAYGDAIANGFIYQGSGIPALAGKFVFGDITTGRLFYSDWEAMLAADDGDPASRAAPQPITLNWDDPHDSPDQGPQEYERFFEIVEAAYDHRGGVDADLPGGATISGTGRADIRLAVDSEGELYVTSKSDGMIRRLMGAAAPEFTGQPEDRVISLGADTTFSATATADGMPEYRWQRLPAGESEWSDVANDALHSGATTATLSVDSPGYARSGDQYRCVATAGGASAFSSSALLVLRAIPDSWLGIHFSPGEHGDLSISGDMADPDGDGLANLLEYAFAFDPAADSSAELPELETSGGNASISFPAPRAALDYRVERSTDLVEWDTEGVSTTSSGGIMTASCPLASASKAFLRIVVEPE